MSTARRELTPIADEADLDLAIAEIDRLIDRDTLPPEESAYLTVLTALVEEYEHAHYPMEPVSAPDMLRYIIDDAQGITREEAARRSGVAASTISAIIRGKRPMNLDHMRAFAKAFHVSVSVFLAE